MKKFLLSSAAICMISAFSYAQNPNQDTQQTQKIGLNYSFTHFDKRFTDPWHLASVSYSKQQKWGYTGLNLNYANRFNKNGSELELETYPKFKKGIYAYVGGAAKLSSNALFPNYRVGFSLYQSLGRKLELETGIRHLAFDQQTDVWVLGLGKYMGNAFINLRSYWSRKNGRWNESFILSSKFYLSDDRFDFFSINVGTGVAFDDPTQINNVVYQLNSFRAGADYSRNIGKKSIIKAGFQWINEEYQNDTYGNQLGANIGFSQKF